MSVVTEQPNTTGANQDLPPGYSERAETPSAGLHPPGYDDTLGQHHYGRRQSRHSVVSSQHLLWMPMPTNVPLNCPPGLEYLTAVDQMFMEQRVELIEALVNVECANKYRIVNSLNQQVYFATEESEMCERLCCRSARGFTMHIWDNSGTEVMRIVRPFQCLAGCCWCADKAVCSLYIEVEAPVGQVVGRVRQTKSLWAAHYDILSPNDDDIVLKIRGPTCVCDGPCFTDDQDFVISTPDLKNEIGKISKKWSGFFREMLSNADKFGMSFPIDLDVKLKATLFGALFLIDFMFFENQEN